MTARSPLFVCALNQINDNVAHRRVVFGSWVMNYGTATSVCSETSLFDHVMSHISQRFSIPRARTVRCTLTQKRTPTMLKPALRGWEVGGCIVRTCQCGGERAKRPRHCERGGKEAEGGSGVLLSYFWMLICACNPML